MINKESFKLLNGSKQEVTYPDKETVTFPAADGIDVVTFTAGEPLDALEVSQLDFSEGDQTVDVPEGYVARSAVVSKPENMEKVIGKGETLAGVAGEYVTPGTTKTVALDFSGAGGALVDNQAVAFQLIENWEIYVGIISRAGEIIPETQYTITWDGAEYISTCRIMAGVAYLGNLGIMAAVAEDELGEIEDTGEPFCFLLFTAENEDGETLTELDVATLEEGDTHTVSLSTEGGGNQTIKADGDERWNEVVIEKPETLVAENIAAGVTVAGVEGNAQTAMGLVNQTISGTISDDSITSLRGYLFYGCKNLEAVSFPACVVVGDSAFYGCTNLGTATFPACNSIGSYAFYECTNLSKIEPGIWDSASPYCFARTRISEITLSTGSEFFCYLASYMFLGCSNLEKISFMYSGSYVSGCFKFFDLGGTTTLADGAFAGCEKLSSIKISALGGILGNNFFSNCYNLQSISLIGMFRSGNSSEYYGNSAYVEVGTSAFYNCSKLSQLTIPLASRVCIGSSAFQNCITLSYLKLTFTGVSYSSWICSLPTNAFANTPFSSSGLLGYWGSIYVPSSYYTWFRARPGWSAYSARMVSF